MDSVPGHRILLGDGQFAAQSSVTVTVRKRGLPADSDSATVVATGLFSRPFPSPLPKLPLTTTARRSRFGFRGSRLAGDLLPFVTPQPIRKVSRAKSTLF
jgi:hypothetical protein